MNEVNWSEAPEWANLLIIGLDGIRYWTSHNASGASLMGMPVTGGKLFESGTNHGWDKMTVLSVRPEEFNRPIATPNRHDEVNNPKHYDLFEGQQAIDVIRASLTPEEFAGYCKGNFLKYRLRAGEKGDPLRCLAKSDWYRDYLKGVRNE